MLKMHRSILFFWFALTWSVPQAHAREWLAVGSDFSGIFEPSGSSEIKGLGPDVLRLIVEQWGDTIRFESFPWARAQMKVEQGTADILVCAYKNPERELRFTFSRIPLFQDQLVFFQKRQDNWTWNGDFASLRAKRIGYILGWAYGTSFESARASMPLIKVTTLEEGVSKLIDKRIDFLAANQRDMEGWISSQKTKPDIQAIEPPIGKENAYFAFPRKPGYEAIRDRFDRALQGLISHRQLDHLARKYKIEIP